MGLLSQNRFFMFWVFIAICFSPQSKAQHHQESEPVKNSKMSSSSVERLMPMGPEDCSEMSFWEYSTASCQPLPMTDMPMKMWMLHGNAFLLQTIQEGPRGKNRLVAPNMIMGDIGKSYGDTHYLNLNVMLTAERWSFPDDGYPELLQIGERDINDRPYIDAQHPHSSPIMGLTLSDTIRLGAKDHLRIFFAPRGQATEGPIAFMHRPSGMINPEAPLGHHTGQDVSHISSTVFGASLGLGRTRLEASTFNGTEPEPARVDLPLGTPNSYAARLIYEFSDKWSVLASGSYVKDPEPHDSTLEKVYRYSVSSYIQHDLDSGWKLHDAFVFGLINYYDHIAALRSFLYEFWFHSERPYSFWGRFEFVERTPSQLAITTLSDSQNPRWVNTLTAGHTHDLVTFKNSKLSFGLSVTKNFVPEEFEANYGGDPWSGRLFLQLTGMKMGSL